MKCYDCPRGCGTDRRLARGFCGCGSNAVVAKVIDGFEYEEPCIGKARAVFFGGCNLKCTYCQNIAISHCARGREYDSSELARLLGGDSTVDLVTPTHFLSAIERAAELTALPRIVYNTSGYETTQAIDRAAAISAVFLSDLKYVDSALSSRFSAAPDYFEYASKALKRMRRVTDCFAAGIMTRGLVVRHMVLPGCTKDSIAVLDFIAAELGTDTVISLMSQFTPNGAGAPHRKVSALEYKLVCEHALKLGFGNGYFQDFSSADSSFTPEF